MKKTAGLLSALFLLFLVTPLRADVLILAHGYSGNALSWERSGVVSILEAHGWPRAGMLTVGGPNGIHLAPAPGANAANKVYVVNMPSEAPILVQTQQLEGMLNLIAQRHPDEDLILAGHSVGGVVARLALVRSGGPNVKALITIASPHLGTPRAEQALDVTDSDGPLDIIKEFFGGGTYNYLEYSRPLLVDIIRPRPGTLLHWLNLQPHPAVTYVSVIRSQSFPLMGDVLVPGYSQDMNNILPLRGRSRVIPTATGHSLTPGDGMLLVNVLAHIQAPVEETTKKDPE
ncbi:MAG: hypothetical protein HQL52_03670 [Magnetococcales bacterium]|nr:hypothetical protein [Magnetococcales bacterium]